MYSFIEQQIWTINSCSFNRNWQKKQRLVKSGLWQMLQSRNRRKVSQFEWYFHPFFWSLIPIQLERLRYMRCVTDPLFETLQYELCDSVFKIELCTNNLYCYLHPRVPDESIIQNTCRTLVLDYTIAAMMVIWVAWQYHLGKTSAIFSAMIILSLGWWFTSIWWKY